MAHVRIHINFNVFARKGIHVKKLTAILFMLVIFVQNFSTVIAIAGYHLNKTYIISNFCVNKDRPQLHCKGKCFLSKQIREEEEKAASPLAANKKEGQFQLYFSGNDPELSVTTVSLPIRTYFSFNDLATSSHINAIFHPPGA